MRLTDAQVDRLYRRARAERWDVPREEFAAALEQSVTKSLSAKNPAAREIDRYLESLHLEDLALACACAGGRENAWEHFMMEQRPVLYRAADAIDPTGGARELADALYADLYGLPNREGSRRSLFRYFHGRSSLSTWLRALLSQRHVDRIRAERRLEPLPEHDSAAAPVARSAPPGSDHARFVELMRQAFARAVARLDPRDRLRLGCYYAQEMTLVQIGRLTRESEATVSRHLTRTRRAIREDIERQLREEARLSDAQMDECFASVMADAGTLDLDEMLEERKETAAVRSKGETTI
jgi:RNA polymerase sigma-70 factor, ECF subfamily